MTTAAPNATSVQLQKLSVGYGRTRVLHELALDVRGGELLALLGPSGCGKTTLLKVIAGLLTPSHGRVQFGAEDFTHIPAERRAAAMVFQKPLLFPQLTVAENVAFGLKMRKLDRAEIAQRVTEALAMVQLSGYERRLPRELSGGQEQRVALARALVIKPRVLLLDEPFSALDVRLRGEMRALVRQLQQQLGITTLFVTHDQEEAVAVAHRIALLLDGQLAQLGPPRDFYTAPATPAVAQFFGWQMLEGRFHGQTFETASGALTLPASVAAHVSPSSAKLAFHPLQLRWHAADATNLALPGLIESRIELGALTRYNLALHCGARLTIEAPTPSPIALPAKDENAVTLWLPATALKIFA